MWLQTKKGFTLPEVLVVMIVIGILVMIVVPQLLMSYQKAQDKKALAEIRNIALAIGVYRVDHDAIPFFDNYADLVELLNNTTGIAPIPPKDAWGHEFYYYATDSANYTLKSLGRDGIENNPAKWKDFDADADTIVINGVFVANHE